MINEEVYELLNCFGRSYINGLGEVILKEKGNVYFTIKHCNNKRDIVLKLLEWCSRPMCKGCPYASEKRNSQWRDDLIKGLNRYLGTNFTQEDMYWIYDKIGNGVDRELAEKFIDSGYDMGIMRNGE